MADSTKKISFGFSKLSKHAVLPKRKRVDHEISIQYIDCLESKSIKVKEPVFKEEIRELVIPVRSKHEGDVGNSTKFSRQERSVVKIDTETTNRTKYSAVTESLDTLAAREIIEDLERKKNVEKNNVLALPLVEQEGNGVFDRAPTLDDYEAVPISDFGKAMLRGMGWNPGKGIGKTEKIAPAVATPVLRPKGMGLGAEQLASAPVVEGNSAEENERKVVKGAPVKIIAGIHKDLYGQIEGFDEDGRVIVKSALGKSSVSVLECMVRVVSESEYKRHARVLNLSQYEEQKRMERKDIEKGSRTSNSDHKRRRRTENE